MTEDQEKWFEELWQCYPSDLAQKKKGSKSVAAKSVEKLNPDEKLRNRILVCMRELMRHCRKEKKELGQTDRWPFVSTWINQERWNCIDDISASDLRSKTPAKKCKCGGEVAWRDLCWTCYEREHPDPWMNLRRQQLERLSLVKGGESKADVIESCRNHLKSTGILERTLSGRKG